MTGFLSTFTAAVVFIIGGIFTLRFRAFYLLRPTLTLRALPFKSGAKQMLLSLGGTVGVGNISGVAVAIALGGAGAVFWMWVGAFFSMALKYAEIILGMLTRRRENGKMRGGAAYYIKERLGGLAAVIFSLLLLADCIMMGGVIQSSAISESANKAFGISPAAVGVFVSLLAAAVFFFKVDLFKLSSYVVPIMSIGYIIAAAVVIILNYSKLSAVFAEIFADAFTPASAFGGFFGVLTSPCVRQGIVKGLFSNEAGCGTAPSAHIASSETEPCRQGLFGIFEVFIDTILMCTLTALVILLTLGDVQGQSGGAAICADAFSSVFGEAASAVLSVFVTLFAFCTIIAFGHYGRESLSFFKCGDNAKNLFLLVYCLSLFVGAVAAPRVIWEICDCVVCLMLIINTASLLLSQRDIVAAHRLFYVHIGKYASSASKMRSRSSSGTKNEIPISDSDK